MVKITTGDDPWGTHRQRARLDAAEEPASTPAAFSTGSLQGALLSGTQLPANATRAPGKGGRLLSQCQHLDVPNTSPRADRLAETGKKPVSLSEDQNKLTASDSVKAHTVLHVCLREPDTAHSTRLLNYPDKMATVTTQHKK